MSSAQTQRILQSQYRRFLAEKSSYKGLYAITDEQDIKTWYFLVTGIEGPFLGGEYLFKLTAPNDFPQKPPSFEFMTPNGLFDTKGRICISVGEYHANDFARGSHGSHGWRKCIGMMGFAVEVMNAMICFDGDEHGIGILSRTIDEKKYLASMSREYNISNYTEIMSEFILQFPELIPSDPSSDLKDEASHSGESLDEFLEELLNCDL